MSNKFVQVDPNKTITCEANGCHSRAEFRVIIRVGSKGNISFFLCERCRPNFCADSNDCMILDKGDKS